jgi:hypothetical protein
MERRGRVGNIPVSYVVRPLCLRTGRPDWYSNLGSQECGAGVLPPGINSYNDLTRQEKWQGTCLKVRAPDFGQTFEIRSGNALICRKGLIWSETNISWYSNL